MIDYRFYKADLDDLLNWKYVSLTVVKVTTNYFRISLSYEIPIQTMFMQNADDNNGYSM